MFGDHFVTQKSFPTPKGEVRPDCIVFLPDQSNLVIDSKVPFNKLLESFDATDEQVRKQLLKEHADAVLIHAKALNEKEYQTISNGLEFVIMFFPFESILSAATEGHPGIISELAKLKILPATPTGIIGLINLIGYIWRQDKLARSTVEISRQASIHLDNLNSMFTFVKKTRKNLNAAINAFNEMARRFENSVLRSATELRDLGAHVNKPLPEAIDPIDRNLREIESSELESDIIEIESDPEG